ncbi:MAG TPA: ATP-binding protein [Myxococcota bacterium]|nr:ATP-binding protein [Myxococcota bacterium]HQK51450.1 ATP-binding protein [Myxococcota bacterium]
MDRPPAPPEPWSRLWSPWAALAVWGPIAAVTAAHYLTGHELHYLHDIFRRLYYIPIILAAFLFGMRGAVAAAVVVSLVYLPHAFTTFLVMDPAHGIEKVLEILLYHVVGVVTGLLADRERRERRRAETLVQSLEATLEDRSLMQQELVRAGRLSALGQMTAGLAHEIRNPLASLKGTAQILGDEIAPDSPRRRMLDLHLREIDRLAAILDRFLAFARPHEVTHRDSDLARVVDDVIALLEPQARRQHVRLERVPGSLPPIPCDPSLMAQVLMNLLLNAIQAMPDGGTARVALRRVLRGPRRFAGIEVTDTGPGVPEDLRDRIFDPLFTTRPDGAGLGLSLSARIVEAHDGLIEVSQAPGGGACFLVLLPEGS